MSPQLIAAAPDLLEALRGMVKVSVDYGVYCEIPSSEIIKALNAILKATGKSVDVESPTEYALRIPETFDTAGE